MLPCYLFRITRNHFTAWTNQGLQLHRSSKKLQSCNLQREIENRSLLGCLNVNGTSCTQNAGPSTLLLKLLSTLSLKDCFQDAYGIVVKEKGLCHVAAVTVIMV
ncbi:hypothetical protein Y032_0285g1352 [Ancylostoma ceylanicum]|uniref:Uncharacterized protein n=1 Tax=Ancylostoma ceylanicum TaxID=53326 RepID=A0A016S7A0_9BILA|nr:hypothetical protein Y032_0285g1352 [Ancylostoma ceylanicum]